MSEAQARPGQRQQSKASAHRARRWIPYVGGLLLVSLIVAGLWPKPVAVETAKASRGPLKQTVDEEGKTRIRRRYVVAAPVTGQLRRIGFKAGAAVEAGQTVVAVIEPLNPTLLDARSRSAAEAKRDTAAANLEKARAEHGFAASELRRFEKLYQQKTVSIQEWEQAQVREAAAAKDESGASSALRQAQAELEEFSGSADKTGEVCPAKEIKAPASGRVLRVMEENARVVTAGTPLLEIGDPTDLEVVVEVLSRDGAAIEPGAKVEFNQWGGPAPLLGRVRLIEPAAFTKVSALGVEEQRVNVVADLLSPADARPGVGDNFRVEASIILWQAPQALKVPAGALFRRGVEWACFTVQNGVARQVTVQTGHSSGTETEILAGLEEGADVVLYPSSHVSDGQKVSMLKITPR